MQETIFVLMMVLSPGYPNSHVVTLTQEFSSFERCENARRHLAGASTVKTLNHDGVNMVRAQGCFRK